MPRFAIKTWVGGRKLFEKNADTLKEVVERAVVDKVNLTGAYLRDASLHNANLTGAYLYGVDLTGAYLTGAYLTGADLTGAYLTGANLRDAILHNANLTGVNLYGADLRSANLTGANLTRANMTGTNLTRADLDGAIFDDNMVIDTGETWGKYLTETVPALLTSGGKSIEEVLATGCWDCHEWHNCPMHVALGIDTEDEAPFSLRQRVHQFVKFFDSGLIPAPVVSE